MTKADLKEYIDRVVNLEEDDVNMYKELSKGTDVGSHYHTKHFERERSLTLLKNVQKAIKEL